MAKTAFNYLLVSIACQLLAGWPHAEAQEGAAVAEVLSLTGSVEVFSNRSGSWNPATVSQYLYAGDAVRTGDPGLAVILTNDGSRISVNRNSRFVLKEVPDSAPWLKVTIREVKKSIYQLLPWRPGKSAEVAIENDSRHVDIEIETRTVKAGIRGTSLVLKVLPETAGDTSIVSVLEGAVQVTALTVPDDSQIAESAQQIVAERGKPLVLRALTVSPADAVQWTLFVPDMVPSLQTASIGVCVMSKEGLAVETLQAADLLVPDIHAALALLENPLRLVASLRK